MIGYRATQDVGQKDVTSRHAPAPTLQLHGRRTRVVAATALLLSLAAIVMALAVSARAESTAEAAGVAAGGNNPWYRQSDDGAVEVTLYFFWSETCPHCARARPAVDQIVRQRPWLRLRSYNVDASETNLELFRTLTTAIGRQIEGVPAFLFCGQMLTGFGTAEDSGPFLARLIDLCRVAASAQFASRKGPAPPVASSKSPSPQPPSLQAPPVDIPFVGTIDAASLSLPLLTVVLGGLDAFNPCAFFVLLFLLSILVHARNRARMLLVGGTFLVVSGLLYFAFMAAWLNLFLVLRGLEAVTIVAGVTAVALATLNIKAFFRLNQGPTLAIPDKARPRLVARMHGLLSAQNLPAMLAGTIALALAANTYELLCTSGLPMVYTRALTLNDLPTAMFYVYLAFYNVIYVLPLLTITVVFTMTLGGRRLGERAGRALKLLSGLLMLGVGLVLLLAPALLDNLLTAVALLAAALALTALAVLLDRRLRRAA
jgi:hypothetical protein